MKFKTKFGGYLLAIFMLIIAVGLLSGCEFDTEANTASREAKDDAEHFEVGRRFILYNTRTNTIELEILGAFSREDDNGDSVALIIKTGENQYKRHIVRLNPDLCYVIEDLTGYDIGKYQYSIKYFPESLSDYK